MYRHILLFVDELLSACTILLKQSRIIIISTVIMNPYCWKNKILPIGNRKVEKRIRPAQNYYFDLYKLYFRPIHFNCTMSDFQLIYTFCRKTRAIRHFGICNELSSGI